MENDTVFTQEWLSRYSRHIVLPELGVQGQKRLQNATVLIVGVGGLGCAAAYYLAAAGVGHLVLNDFDTVELSNLQRQILHRPATLGVNKALSAKATLHDFSPHTVVTAVDEQLGEQGLMECIAGADVVLDCSDNRHSRLAINQACFVARKPLVSAAAIRFEGQLIDFDFRQGCGPCYACLEPADMTANLSCASSGVTAPLVGIIGCQQAMACVNRLLDLGRHSEKKAPELALYDAKSGRWNYLSLTANPQCGVCS